MIRRCSPRPRTRSSTESLRRSVTRTTSRFRPRPSSSRAAARSCAGSRPGLLALRLARTGGTDDRRVYARSRAGRANVSGASDRSPRSRGRARWHLGGKRFRGIHFGERGPVSPSQDPSSSGVVRAQRCHGARTRSFRRPLPESHRAKARAWRCRPRQPGRAPRWRRGPDRSWLVHRRRSPTCSIASRAVARSESRCGRVGLRLYSDAG